MGLGDGIDPAAVVRGLAPALADLSATLVALDFDGVLSPIVSRPSDARALPGMAEALIALAPRVARVAVVTGRPAADAVTMGGLEPVPGLVVLGHYGLERYENGVVTSPGHHPGVDPARARLRELVASRPGTTVEDKAHSVAVHTRNAPDPAGALAELVPRVDAIANETGLQVTPGRFVLELRPPGVDKGVAILGLIDEVGARVVVYGGDDIGDLPAVAALRSRSDIAGIVVCSDAEEASPVLRGQADLVVPGPPGVLAVLRALA